MRRNPRAPRPEPRPSWQIAQGAQCPCQNENPWPRPPTRAQLRAWKRRAESLEGRARALTDDMMAAVGAEFEMAGENLTSQADDVAAGAENLVSYLATCIRITPAGRPALKDHPHD